MIENIIPRGFLLCFFLLIGVNVHAGDNGERAADLLRLALPATAYGMTFGFNDQEGRGYFYKSFLTTLGITYGLKHTVDKKRPNGNPRAFPSGHTSEAFSGASFIQRRYGWKYGIPSYIIASFVGWSRVDSDHHYPEDVLAGAAIGIISTYVFTKPYTETLQVVPLSGDGKYGLALEVYW
jgi:membrane-associated phospholipid phosphatase